MRNALSRAALALCLQALLIGMPANSLASSTAKASDSVAPPPPVVVVATFLDLSPAQAEQFQTLLATLFDTLGRLEEQKKAREQALQQLTNSPHPNPAAIGVVVLQIHAIEQQGAQAIQTFHQAFLSLLSSEQVQKVQAVAQAAQLAPVVGAFQALYLVPPTPPGPSTLPRQ